jgi:receptor protein-tyrosine kinase
LNQHDIASLSSNAGLGDRSIASASYDAGMAYPSQWQPRETEEEGVISPRFLLRVLSHWWYIALPIGCLLAIVSAALVMLTFTPVYRSTAVMKIASYTPYIAYTVNEQPMKPEEFTETQIELLRSPLVMEQLLTKPEIAALPHFEGQENPAKWLSKQVQVDQVGNSELYYVYLDAPNPESSALLVNAILDEYFAVRARDEESQTERVLELLNQEKETRAEVIQNLREEMRELGKHVMGADPVTGMPTQSKGNIMAPLNKQVEQLADLEMECRMLELEIIAIRETIEQKDIEVADVEVEMAITETEEVQRLRALIANKREMLFRIESVAVNGKEDSTYKIVEREIASLERSLQNATQQARPQIASQLKTMAALDNADLLKQLERELELKMTVRQLRGEQYAEQLASAGESGDQLMELEFKRNELAREERVFEMIAERSMALTTESRAPGRVALLQRAEQPIRPVESLPLRNLAAAILASGCLPFGLALAWELSVRRISDSEQLSQHGALPVVGEVAKLPMRIQSITPRGKRGMSLFEESIDSLRVGLVLPDQNRDVKVLAITSAVHSEGKSSISSQLAVSIGRSCGQPVLLIDGDLRAPDVHHIFDIPNEPGFAAVLDGRATLDEAINTSWNESIHLLPAGRLRKSPHMLMTVDLLRKLVDELRPRYGYIIIDTPPILSASEALMLAKVADGTVLSTRRNVSRENQVRTAYERLLKAGARPMGAVFNGVPTRSYASAYGSYDYARSFD